MTTLTLLPLLAGCEAIDSLKEDVEGLTNPLVVQGMYLGGGEPEAGVDLSGTDFDQAAQATVLLADAASVDDLQNAPVTGASVTLRSETGGSVALGDEGGGRYAASSEDGLVYAAGEQFVMSIETDVLSKVAIVAPPEPEVDLPDTHTAGEPLNVLINDTDVDSAVVVVIDGASGEVTFSNEPADIRELYDLTHGKGTTRVEIPGEAFRSPSVYAVGVAGLNAASADDFEELNTALSGFLAGKFRFYALTVQ